jgi:hypothetical protein
MQTFKDLKDTLLMLWRNANTLIAYFNNDIRA